MTSHQIYTAYRLYHSHLIATIETITTINKTIATMTTAPMLTIATETTANMTIATLTYYCDIYCYYDYCYTDDYCYNDYSYYGD